MHNKNNTVMNKHYRPSSCLVFEVKLHCQPKAALTGKEGITILLYRNLGVECITNNAV